MGKRFDRALVKDLLEKNEIRVSDFRAAMPGVPEQTIFSRIRALEKDGLIYSIGHGVFSTARKIQYQVEISEKMRAVHQYVVDHFEGLSFCISESDDNLLICVSRSEVSPLVLSLSKEFTLVFDRRSLPSTVTPLKDAILVDYLVSESPLEEREDITTPSIEKVLIDNYVDDKKRESKPSFQRAFEVYQINKNTLLRYAARRNVKQEVSLILDNLDINRINTVSTIQRYLSQQPVERAWLFGSFARGEDGPESDIDMLVDYQDSEKLSLLDIAKISTGLEDIVHKKIDLIENGHLLPFAQPSADRDKYLIYERTA